eukprot:15341741-Alexandrium_andersonii.AAC.1
MPEGTVETLGLEQHGIIGVIVSRPEPATPSAAEEAPRGTRSSGATAADVQLPFAAAPAAA